MNSSDPHARTPDNGRRRCGALLRGAVLGATFLVASISQSTAQNDDRRNRFSVNSRIGFNLKAEFKNLGGLPARNNPGPATGGVDHFYDDGFNRVDSSGNTNGTTRFWGYQNPSQIPGDDTVVMTSLDSPSNGMLRVNDDPQLGAELSWFRVLGEDRAYRWGFEAAVGWMDLAFDEDRTFAGDVIRTSDVYGLAGNVPPRAPYAGTYEGSGPSIAAVPTRAVSTLTNAAVTSGQYNLDTRAYSLRLGLRYESPFNDRIALHFGGGFSGAFVDSEFNFHEMTTTSGLGNTTLAGTGSRTDFILGGYAGAGVTLQVSRRVAVFAGAQYEHLGNFSQQAGGKSAKIDFGNALFVTIGLGLNL